jgi:GT2 family glycosyltransferase
MTTDAAEVDWVVLTMGNRPDTLRTALDSLCDDTTGRGEVVVVSNGAGPLDEVTDHTCARVVASAENVGVPQGRHLGLRGTTAPVVGFLDDDASASAGASRAIAEAFHDEPRLAAVSLRVTDEHGVSAREHIPRAGGAPLAGRVDVAYFLGGACAIRRTAYEEVGGYFGELFYGHEEIELGWRLVDAGWSIRYLGDVEVFHPRAAISRHPEGWALTGRNRVLVARRTLPWPIALVHVAVWLPLGLRRAPRSMWRSYVHGWCSGWRHPIERRPIRFRTVWTLTRLGRPPLI